MSDQNGRDDWCDPDDSDPEQQPQIPDPEDHTTFCVHGVSLAEYCGLCHA